MTAVSMYCDICGEVFLPYKPKLVVCYLPEGEPSEVIQMCQDCEKKVMRDVVVHAWKEDTTEREFPYILYDCTCHLEADDGNLAEALKTGHISDITQYLLRVELDKDNVERAKNSGVHVTPAQNNGKPYILLECQPVYTTEDLMSVPLGEFKADVHFWAVYKGDHATVKRAILNYLKIREVCRTGEDDEETLYSLPPDVDEILSDPRSCLVDDGLGGYRKVKGN